MHEEDRTILTYLTILFVVTALAVFINQTMQIVERFR